MAATTHTKIEAAARALVMGQGSPWTYLGNRVGRPYTWLCMFCLAEGTRTHMIHRDSCNWWRLEQACAARANNDDADDQTGSE